MEAIRRVILGTRNEKKGRELVRLLEPHAFRPRTLADIPAAIEVEETGLTFSENAALKATRQALHLREWVIGEDSGLRVDSLDGAPGVYSARFSGPDATDRANNDKLLAELGDLPLERRAAHYVCHVTLSDPEGNVRIEAEDYCRGRILFSEKGAGGFGYDPLFEIPEYHRTFGQLGDDVKSVLSHRSRALRKFVPALLRLAATGALLLLVVAGLSRKVTAREPETTDDSVAEWVEADMKYLVDLYRHLHAHPELSFQERETSARVAKEWEETGAEVTRGVGGHGVVGLLKNGDGPVLMLRTDLDALPVAERTGLVFASKVKVENDDGTSVGVMHACGHDLHMTNLIGTARYLAAHKNHWSGTVMLVGQPAEERGAGAKAMLEDGLFERFPRPDYAVAVHVDATLEAGKIGYRAGYALANVDSVDITMKGKGGHGAFPHTTIDPVVQAAQLVLSLQAIVSREIKPIEPAVVTVGSIHGGTKHNIIGDECRLQLTVRSYSDEVRRHLLSSIRRKAEAAALAAGAPEPVVEISEGTPSLLNDQDLAERLDPVFRRAVGAENVVTSDPSMGGEDFSRYGRAGVPILMYRLGVVEPRRLERFKQLGQQPPSLHSPLFYPDVEPALVAGIVTMSEAAVELLRPGR